jgi:hypothetical protein
MDQNDETKAENFDEPSPPLPWPSADHSLTRSDPNWTLSSCIKGWSKESATSRIIGYRDAAELIFRRLAEDRGGRDTLVFPLVFLWRHAIELQLKNIVERGQIVLEEQAAYPKHHGLREIWTMAIRVIKELQEEDNGEIENVSKIIAELCTLDPDSAGFRYHETKKGQPTLDAAPEYLHLGSINDALSGVSSYLDCVDAGLEQMIDYIAEAYRDWSA